MRKGVAQVRRLKLVFIGPGGVGKSSLTMRLQGQTTFVANLPATDGVAVGMMKLASSEGMLFSAAGNGLTAHAIVGPHSMQSELPVNK